MNRRDTVRRTFRGGPPETLPPVSGTVVAWFDASNSATDITLTGSDLTAWASRGGTPLIDNGDNTFVENEYIGIPDRPSLVSGGLGGLDYVRFDSSVTERMNHAAGGDRWFADGNVCSIYMLHRQWSSAHSETWLGAPSYNTGPYQAGFTSGKPLLSGGSSVTFAGAAPGTAWVGTSWNWATSGASTSRVSQNRVHTTGTWTTIYSVSSSLCEIMRSGLNIDIAEMIIVSGAETTTSHETILDYWNAKWGTGL